MSIAGVSDFTVDDPVTDLKTFSVFTTTASQSHTSLSRVSCCCWQISSFLLRYLYKDQKVVGVQAYAKD